MEFDDGLGRPAGFRFHPKDEELVLLYLLKKLRGRPLPCASAVRDCDLYGELEPWDIWSKYHHHGDDDDEELYFFTPLKKKKQNFKRFVRSVGTHGATWHEENTGEPGESHDGKVVWELKRYKYLSKKDSEKKKKRKRGQDYTTDPDHDHDDEGVKEGGGWFLDEYKLKDEEIPYLGLDRTAVNSLVVCRLRKAKEDSKKKKNGKKRRKVIRYLDDDDAAAEQEQVVVGTDQNTCDSNKEITGVVTCPVVVEDENVVGGEGSSGLIQDWGEDEILKLDELLSSDDGDLNLEYTTTGSSAGDVMVIPQEEEEEEETQGTLDDFFTGLGDFLHF